VGAAGNVSTGRLDNSNQAPRLRIPSSNITQIVNSTGTTALGRSAQASTGSSGVTSGPIIGT